MDASSERDQLKEGRAAYERQEWSEAYSWLSAADAESPLESDDLVRLATAAYLIGRDDEAIEILTRAHQEAAGQRRPEQAVRCAFWLILHLLNKGDHAQAGGWFERGRKLLDEDQLDCVEQGFMLIPGAYRALFGGDAPAAAEICSQAADIGARFGDPDLVTLASFGRGKALIQQGYGAEGIALLDEIMVGVASGEVSPILTGIVYCGVIEACQDVFDLRRAHEWTQALNQWCASQPDLVPYRGQCLVYRAEIMQFQGAWPDAIQEAERAREQLMEAPDQVAVGMAFYQLGELHRLRGDFADAEGAYRQASKWGRTPQPGLARLRLAQGQIEAAVAAIRREVDEAQDPVTRPKILPACVDIMLEAGDVAAARAAADELSGMAAEFDAQLLHTLAANAQGAVLLAEGNPRAALTELRQAWTGWQHFEAPYEAARARVLIGLACKELGDHDTAEMELDAARWRLEQLGARPDLQKVEKLLAAEQPGASDGLTGREFEVLRLLAAGKSNREIAADLVISDKTVARHVSNIFVKVGVTSRSAATAYAFKHDLV